MVESSQVTLFRAGPSYTEGYSSAKARSTAGGLPRETASEQGHAGGNEKGGGEAPCLDGEYGDRLPCFGALCGRHE